MRGIEQLKKRVEALEKTIEPEAPGEIVIEIWEPGPNGGNGKLVETRTVELPRRPHTLKRG